MDDATFIALGIVFSVVMLSIGVALIGTALVLLWQELRGGE